MMRLGSLFFKLLFPKLCYGCQGEGALLCQRCLGMLRCISSEGRCSRCFGGLSYQESHVCSRCASLSKIHMHCIFPLTAVALSLYKNVCWGKALAREVFAVHIRKQWEILDLVPEGLLYTAPELKELAQALCIKNLRYSALWRKKRLWESCSKEKSLHLLSPFPLTWRQRAWLENNAPGPVWITSVFLPEEQL